jgi:hypothetical protein
MPYAPSSATKTITVVAPKQQPPSQPSQQPTTTPGTQQWQLPKQPIWMWIAIAGAALIGIGIILISFRK